MARRERRGRLAVQIARYLGAGKGDRDGAVVPDALASLGALGADVTIPLGDEAAAR